MITATWQISCDADPAGPSPVLIYIAAGSQPEAEEHARGEGWLIKDGRHICPTHRPPGDADGLARHLEENP